MFEKLEGKVIPSHSSAGLAGVSFKAKKTKNKTKLTFSVDDFGRIRFVLVSRKQLH